MTRGRTPALASAYHVEMNATAHERPDAAGPDILSIERPAQNLLRYYALRSLIFGPFFPIAFTVLFFRYRTMRYRFDDEGVSMRWGALFRREISLTYSRIQDIHMVSNLVERRLGLARLKVQTAAGSAAAEMTIEGLEAFEAVRDFLYERMRRRRARGESPVIAKNAVTSPTADRADWTALVEALREVSRELRLTREALEARDGKPRSEDG